MRVLALALAFGPVFASANAASIMQTVCQGAGLRIAGDLTLGLPTEVWKTRVMASKTKAVDEIKKMWNDKAGVKTFYTGWKPRMVEATFQGGAYLAGASIGANLCAGYPSLVVAAGTGAMGGLIQSLLMTPTSLVLTKTVQGSSSLDTVKSIWKKDGLKGFYQGGGAMALRQSTNWCTRSFFHRLAFNNLPLTGGALALSSGVVGGVMSTWNTPIEVARVRIQADKSKAGVVDTLKTIYKEDPKELYRGGIPRAVQSVWQTTFLIVLPELLK